MEIILKNETIEMIRRFATEAGVKIPLQSPDDIDELSAFFGDMEDNLSNASVNGREIDEEFFAKVVAAHDDLNMPDNEDYVDLEKLNKRLI